MSSQASYVLAGGHFLGLVGIVLHVVPGLLYNKVGFPSHKEIEASLRLIKLKSNVTAQRCGILMGWALRLRERRHVHKSCQLRLYICHLFSRLTVLGLSLAFQTWRDSLTAVSQMLYITIGNYFGLPQSHIDESRSGAEQ
jgi:hypothetical protein